MKLQKDRNYHRESTNIAKLEGKIKELENLIDALEPEINSWVPRIMFGDSEVGITYGTQYGVYHKVGRLVHIWGRIKLTSKGSVSGTAYIAGLPYSVLNNTKYQPIGDAKIVTITFADAFMIEGVGGDKRIQLNEVTNAGTRTVLAYTDFADTSALSFHLVYLTD